MGLNFLLTGYVKTMRSSCSTHSRLALLASLASLLCSATAHADAASDLRNDPSLRLWLDGLDTTGSDVDGSVGTSHPANFGPVPAWKDKSMWGHELTAATGWDAGYWVDTGGVGLSTNGRYTLPPSVYGDTPSNTMDVYIFARPWDTNSYVGDDPFVYMSGLDANNNRVQQLEIHAGYTDTGQGRVAIRHQSDRNTQGTVSGYTGSTTGYLTANFGSMTTPYTGSGGGGGQYFGTLHNIRVNGAGSTLVMQRDGFAPISAAVQVPSVSFANGGIMQLGGRTTKGFGYKGVIGTLMIFSRLLNTAEKTILSEYLSARNRYAAATSGSYQNETYTVTGKYNRLVMDSNTNYPYLEFRDYIGGIGQEADGAVTTGTSAGLTIINNSFLTNGAYLIAGNLTNLYSGVGNPMPQLGASLSKVPFTGVITSQSQVFGPFSGPGFPAGYTAESKRRWFIDRTGGSATGTVTMRFNLANMGVNPQVGQTVAVATRSMAYNAPNGNGYFILGSKPYDGSGMVEFTVTNPPDGLYSVFIGPDLPPAPNPHYS